MKDGIVSTNSDDRVIDEVLLKIKNFDEIIQKEVNKINTKVGIALTIAVLCAVGIGYILVFKQTLLTYTSLLLTGIVFSIVMIISTRKREKKIIKVEESICMLEDKIKSKLGK